jgi:hypothetical protein
MAHRYQILPNKYIRLLDPPFEDVTYQYDKIQFDIQNENTPEEELVVHFEYIFDPSCKDLVLTDQLQTVMGDVLIELIRNSLEDHTTVFKGGS